MKHNERKIALAKAAEIKAALVCKGDRGQTCEKCNYAKFGDWGDVTGCRIRDLDRDALNLVEALEEQIAELTAERDAAVSWIISLSQGCGICDTCARLGRDCNPGRFRRKCDSFVWLGSQKGERK